MRFSVKRHRPEYGDYVSGPGSSTSTSGRTMKQVLAEIRTASFAARWIAENEAGRPEFERLRAADRDHQIEQVGAALRAAMPFLDPVVVSAGRAQAAASAGRSRRETR